MDLSKFKSELSLRNKLLRFLWAIVWATAYVVSPRPFHKWRVFLLRSFGANIDSGVRIDGTARVFYPPNLTLCKNVVIGPSVHLYCVAPIEIGPNSMVSQRSYLCTGSHDYTKPHLPLVAAPIRLGSGVWVCAQAFIGPGVSIGDNAIVAAAAVVVKAVGAREIVGGNPAKLIKLRDDV